MNTDILDIIMQNAGGIIVSIATFIVTIRKLQNTEKKTDNNTATVNNSAAQTNSLITAYQQQTHNMIQSYREETKAAMAEQNKTFTQMIKTSNKETQDKLDKLDNAIKLSNEKIDRNRETINTTNETMRRVDDSIRGNGHTGLRERIAKVEATLGINVQPATLQEGKGDYKA